jgi:drug/metabolite transporter (DMT)-like permease
MIHIAVVCNILGTMGFVRAMQFFENVIIAVATLLEPMIATVIAFFVGVAHLPGPLGWLGNVFVLVGTFLVVLPSVNTGDTSH